MVFIILKLPISSLRTSLLYNKCRKVGEKITTSAFVVQGVDGNIHHSLIQLDK